MRSVIASALDRLAPGRAPAWARWAWVAAFVGLAGSARIVLPGAPPLLPFVLAVVAAAAVGGVRGGLVATAAGLGFAVGPLAPAPAQNPFTLDPGPRALLFGAIGVVLAFGIDALRGQRARLDAAADQMRLVAENAPAIIAHFDGEGRYRFVSNAYCERFGLQPSQVLGRRVRDVVGEDAWASIGPHMARALAGERIEYELETEYEGTGPRFMRIAYVPDRDQSGRVRGLFAALTDLTEHRRLERRLRDLDRRKDEYLAVLSHELRNPLAPIRTAAHALSRLDAQALPMPAASVLGASVPLISRQVAHLSRLVDDLLDATRMSRGAIALDVHLVAFSDAMRVALDSTRDYVASRGHRLAVDLPVPDPTIEADPVRLAQVVSNLLHNAAKFTPTGGTLTLRAWVEPGGERLSIEVGDDGIGIAADRLGEIFEMFVQSEHPPDLAQGGLGIGLALVRELVRLHGGTVEAASDGPGRGSRFVVRLPLRVRAPRSGRLPEDEAEQREPVGSEGRLARPAPTSAAPTSAPAPPAFAVSPTGAAPPAVRRSARLPRPDAAIER